MTALSLQDVGVEIGSRRLLDGVDLRFASGEVTTLLGPNGAGKTTVLRTAAGLIDPTSGRVELAGRALAQIERVERARQIAYLPQDRRLYWSLTVRATVELGRLPHAGRWGLSQRDDEVVDRVLTVAGCDAMAERTVDSLSGGELARVLFARALAVEAPVLLADEPLAGLDPRHQVDLIEQLRQRAAAGVAVVVVAHDFNAALRLGGRAVLIHRGRIVADGPVASIVEPSVLADVFNIELTRVTNEWGDEALITRGSRGGPSSA